MSKNYSQIPLLGALILAASLLGACTSGGSDTANNTGSTPSAVKVTASMGRFSVGTVVNLRKIDATLLGTGSVIADGTATVNIDATYTGPVVVEVVGGPNVFYFDEGTGLDSTAAFTGTLRSAMPAVQANVGVTPLTNAAVANLEATGTLASATASTIQTSNLRVAQVFGLTDILTPPNPVDSNTGATLDVAKEADKYALVLAALAKTAAAGSDAAAVSAALALDLSDNILNGMAGATTITAYTPTGTTGIAAQYQAAATTYATTASAIIVAATPIVITTTDVSTVAVVSNQSDVTQAKAMFTDLRSTAFALSNIGKTGFLDIQSAAIAADTLANVGPDMQKVANRVATFSFANQAFNNLGGWILGANPETGSSTNYGYQSSGTIDAIMKGMGDLQYCYAPSTTFTVFSCVSATSTSGVFTSATTGYIKMVLYKLTPAASPSLNNNYSYTATRMNMPMSYSGGIWSPSNVLQVPTATLPAGSGTLNVQLLAPGSVSAFTLNGTLPPSTSNAAGTAPLTGVDTVNLAFTRTLTTGTTYHIATTGTVATANIDPAITTPNMTITLGTGSYLDSDEAYINTTGALATAVKVIGTVQTPATTFTGTVDLTAFTSSADNYEHIPTSIVFNGSISNATGAILTGAVTSTIPVADQLAFVANPLTQPITATNYRHNSISFTGTILQPNLPVLSLTLANTRDTFYQWTTAINYTFGTKTITGSSVSLDIPASQSHTNTLSVTNQDGVQFGSVETTDWSTFPSTITTTATLTKASTSLASSINMTTGVVNYMDGTSATIY